MTAALTPRMRLGALALVAVLAACDGGEEPQREAAPVRYDAEVRRVFCGETLARSPEEDEPIRYCTAFVEVDGPSGAIAAFEDGDHRLVVDGREVPADAVLVSGSEAEVSFALDELGATPSHLVLDLGGSSDRIPVQAEEAADE